MLDQLLLEAAVTPRQLQLICYGNGPGSFTGVRIAAAVCQAIAVAADCKVVAVSSSRVLAATALAVAGGGRVLTSIRSRGDAYYLSLYEQDEQGALQCRQDDTLLTSPPAWLASYAGADAGSSELLLAGSLPGWLGLETPARVLVEVPDARVMIGMAEQAHAAGDSVDPELALPTYLEGDSPWRKIS